MSNSPSFPAFSEVNLAQALLVMRANYAPEAYDQALVEAGERERVREAQPFSRPLSLPAVGTELKLT